MVKKNADVRKAAKDAGVFLWEIAEKFNVSEPTFIRYLRTEQSDVWKKKAYRAIEMIRRCHERERMKQEHAEMRMLREQIKQSKFAESGRRN